MKRAVIMICVALLFAGCIEQKESTRKINYNSSEGSIKQLSMQITAPIAGSILKGENEVKFDSQVGGGRSPFDYRWTSNLDGVLSTDKSFNLRPSNLTMGEHQVMLQVNDSSGQSFQSSITITVIEEIPLTKLSVQITSPTAGYIIKGENEVKFDSQVEGGEPPFDYRWTSNLDGILSTNKSFSVQPSDLTKGQHHIILQVSDMSGQSAQGSNLISVI
ncbi:MAG: hypothetical protein MUO26_06180 [Methanotrichaceae archaeon]|nr:hypothetical protein [Methanotrichaceae archaeon]